MGTELLNDLDTKFCADNLLTSEDWGLYSYLDEAEESVEMFPGFNAYPMHLYDSQMDVESYSISSSWDEIHGKSLSDLLVKTEPTSPYSSSSSSASSDSSSSCDTPYTLSLGELGAAVKVELSPSRPCPEPLPPPCSALQIQLLSVPVATAQSGCFSKSSSLLSKKPALQPRPAPGVKPAPPCSAPPHTIILHPVTSAPPPPGPAPPITVSQLLAVQSGAAIGPSTVKPEAKPIVPAPSASKGHPPKVDPKLLKRQQRMIKNRESACQSRKKKKEYVQSLEARLQETARQLESARRENGELRERLQHVMRENASLRVSSGHRKVACVMVVLVFVVFNFGPGSLSRSVQKETARSPEISRHTRHLLTYQSEAQSHDPTRKRVYPPRPVTSRTTFSNSSGSLAKVKRLMVRDLDHLFLTSDCRHFNRTESLRLADELSLWVRRHQNDRKTGKQPRRKHKRAKQPVIRKSVSLADLVPAQPSTLTHRLQSGHLQLYRPSDPSDTFLMDAIDRREDTFYVVSFRRDHLLLPAISHNKTSRPKMSLVMPAMSVTDSIYNSSRGYEAMMQIDCEVMDTRVIQIKSSTVPPSLRTPGTPNPSTPQGGPHGNLSLYLQDHSPPGDGQD